MVVRAANRNVRIYKIKSSIISAITFQELLLLRRYPALWFRESCNELPILHPRISTYRPSAIVDMLFVRLNRPN